MAYDVRIATRITRAVDRRLRMYALVKGQPISQVLVTLLDEALPSAEDLALALSDSPGGSTETTDP